MKQVVSEKAAGTEINLAEMSGISSSSCNGMKVKRQKLSDTGEPITNNNKVLPVSTNNVGSEAMEDMGVGKLVDSESETSLDKSQTQSPSKETTGCLLEDEGLDSNNFFMCRTRLGQSTGGEDMSKKLSDELMLMMFRWLPKSALVRCSLVCKRWQQIAYDESLWSRIDLSSRVLKADSLSHVLQRGVLVLRLAQTDVHRPVFTNNSSFLEPGVYCKLQYLDLSMAVVSAADLSAVLKTCQSLVKLSLEHCTVNEESCRAIGKNLDLQVLNMSACYSVTETGIKSILDGCRKLTELNLAWTDLSGSALDVVCTEAPSTLRRLNISGCRKTLSDNHVQRLVRSCPSLVELDLSDCTALLAGALEAVCRLPQLEHVALSRCYSVPSSAYLLLAGIPSLLYLDVIGLFNEQSLVHLEQNLPSISVNKFNFSSIARPTVGVRRTSIWGIKVRR